MPLKKSLRGEISAARLTLETVSSYCPIKLRDLVTCFNLLLVHHESNYLISELVFAEQRGSLPSEKTNDGLVLAH